MAKQFTKRLLCLVLGTLLAAALLAMPAFAADSAAKGYVITFRPGQNASISEDYLQQLQSAGFEYKVSSATGSLSVLVPAGVALPSAPSQAQFVMKDARYTVLDPAPGYTGGNACENLDAVVLYGLIRQGEDYGYTVKYLDRETGAEVAPTMQARASQSMTLTFYAPVVSSYTAEAQSQSLTITRDGANEVVFYYNLNVTNTTTTEVVDGGTTVQYNDVVVTGPAADAGEVIPPADVPLAGGDDGEVINPEDVPLAGGDADQAGEADEGIGDNDVPMSQTPGTESAFSGLFLYGTLGLVALIAVIVAVVLIKRKKQTTEQ